MLQEERRLQGDRGAHTMDRRSSTNRLKPRAGSWGRDRQWGRVVALLVALTWLHCLAWVTAAPATAARVQLRIRTQLTLHWGALPAGFELSGQLADAAGRGVAAAPVALEVAVAGNDNQTAAATTDAQGNWHWVANHPNLPVGSAVTARAVFHGDASRGGASAEQIFDIHKQQPKLQIQTPQQRWLLGGPLWTATVKALVLTEPLAGVEAEVLLDGKIWQRLHTNASGEIALQRPVAALGALGPHSLQVRLVETAQSNAAQLTWSVEIAGVLDVQLRAVAGSAEPAGLATGALSGSSPGIAAGGSTQPHCGVDDWCLQGRVVEAGTQRPMADAAVSLFAARRQLGALTTDADGRFAAVLRGEALTKLFRQAEIDVVAQASVGLPWIDAGWSEVVTLALPEPTRWLEWSGAVALVLLVAAAVVRQWYLRRRRDAQTRLAEAEQAGLPAESFLPGAVTTEPSRALRGVVLHGETGHPCAAQLTLSRSDGTQVSLPCPQGHFQQTDLQDGSYSLWVAVPEHEVLTLALDVPHLGAFEGCELRPASCRAVVRGSLAAVLRKMTGVGMDWGRETPRLVEPRWAQHAKRGRVEIREAVRTTERALYGAHTSSAVVGEVKGALVRVEEAQK